MMKPTNSLGLHLQKFGRAMRPQLTKAEVKDFGNFEVSGTITVRFVFGQNDDPCDDWALFMWNGRLCRLVEYDNGVSPIDDGWSVSWRYEVVETGFIPYGVFRCRKAVPI